MPSLALEQKQPKGPNQQPFYTSQRNSEKGRERWCRKKRTAFVIHVHSTSVPQLDIPCQHQRIRSFSLWSVHWQCRNFPILGNGWVRYCIIMLHPALKTMPTVGLYYICEALFYDVLYAIMWMLYVHVQFRFSISCSCIKLLPKHKRSGG